MAALANPPVAWLVQPPPGQLYPKTTALSAVHAALPTAAIRLEKIEREGRFLLVAQGDGVSTISLLPALDGWTFITTPVPRVPFDGQIIARSSATVAGNGSSGTPTKADDITSVCSSASLRRQQVSRSGQEMSTRIPTPVSLFQLEGGCIIPG